MKQGISIARSVARFILLLSFATFSARADQVSCAVIDLNSDTFGNIGVWIPANATPTGGDVQVRIINPMDNYTDCTNQGLCASPHGDIANVTHWDVVDPVGATNARGLGFTMYNARGAPVKRVKVCYSYRTSTSESREGKLNPKILDLKPYDLLQETFKFQTK